MKRNVYKNVFIIMICFMLIMGQSVTVFAEKYGVYNKIVSDAKSQYGSSLRIRYIDLNSDDIKELILIDQGNRANIVIYTQRNDKPKKLKSIRGVTALRYSKKKNCFCIQTSAGFAESCDYVYRIRNGKLVRVATYRYISGYSGTIILRNSKNISIEEYQNWWRDMSKWKLIC